MTSTTVKSPAARTVGAIVSLFLPLGVVLGSFLLWRDLLPPELASHWSGIGRADGVLAVGQFLTVSAVLSGGAALAGVIVALWPGIRAEARRIGLLAAGIVAGVGAGSWPISATLTMRAGDPTEVVLGAWAAFGVAAAAYGLIPFLLAPKPQRSEHDGAARIDLAPGAGVAWSRTITAPLFLWCSVLLIAVGITFHVTSVAKGDPAGSLVVLSVLVLVSGVLTSFSRFQVTADWRGLRVVSSVLRVPLKRIRLENIESVAAGVLSPGEWGGWGYRVTPGRSALILRRGPGLIITTTNQRQFALTLNQPDVPAALLATLRDAGRTPAATQGPSA